MKSDNNKKMHGFWSVLKEEFDDLPGQEGWNSADVTQFTSILNCYNDLIAISMERPGVLWLDVSGHKAAQGTDRAQRMKMFSYMILGRMSDQDLGGRDWSTKDKGQQYIDKFIANEGNDGRSIKVRLVWNRDDENKWSETASWVKEQFYRLREIINCECGRKKDSLGE